MRDESPPSFYPYVPLPDRKPLQFANGAQLALLDVCTPCSNDIIYFTLFARGCMSASAGLETLKACFDRFYSEGAATGRIMNVGLHPHVTGHAHRIGALRDFVDYARSRTKVWFPSQEEIASWYLTVHEAHIPSGGPRQE